MSACLAFLAIAVQKSGATTPKSGQISIRKGPSVGKIPAGIDAAGIGKYRAGHFVANRDVRSLPTLKDISNEKLLLFSGNVYTLNGDKAPTITRFVAGRKRVYSEGKVSVGETIGDYLRSQDAKADVRLAEATFANFEVVLPTDAKKLAGFDGTLTFFVQNMKPEQALTITLKNGKVVRSMP